MDHATGRAPAGGEAAGCRRRKYRRRDRKHGQRERAELVYRMAVLLAHLLKWHYQPVYRGNSWRLTIEERRRQTRRHLRDNPSLKSWLDRALDDSYGDAAIKARRETGLDVFPPACPFTFDQMMDDDFWPDD